MPKPQSLLSRRAFLQYSAITVGGCLAGCAANPVTGRSQLMLVSESQEISIDKKNSPVQFSSDYGISQDAGLNNYLQQIGSKIAAYTHRPDMPYSFKCVNAVYINAYAFPGGTIAATRGILLAMENEAELAALLGHELGHVNARHTAQQMSKGTLLQALTEGLSMYAGSRGRIYGEIANQLGSLTAGALLASYSRDNEREADALSMDYMVQAGYNPSGVITLMEMLNRTAKHEPNILELMFATHPMNSARLVTAQDNLSRRYRGYKNYPIYRERYMDNTARLRRIKGAIEEMQKADKAMKKRKFSEAEKHLKTALRSVPDDYTALTMMAKVLILQGKHKEAKIYSKKAKKIYPREAQAHQLSGLANLKSKNFSESYQDFSTYDRLLPGNPSMQFYRGYCLEGMQRFQDAARLYANYLQTVNTGNLAKHAYQRLVGWGYINK